MAVLSSICMLCSIQTVSVHAQDHWIEVSTPRFQVEAVDQHAAQASWYAGFVEQVHDELSDLLLTSLDRTIRVRLYPTEEAYVAANPAAASSRGILAHAHPSGDEIGLALVRLEQLPGPSRVAAFRHELTHMLLDIRSNRRLPIGFQEGIAQYMEQDASTDSDSAEGMRRAYSAGKLMSWTDLNQPTPFLQQPNVGYPQSHSMVAFLVEQHGVAGINRLIDAVGQGQSVASAIQTAYGLSSDALEKDWQGSIPEVIRTGLPRNVLDDGSLRPAQQAASEQRWTDAAGLARVAEQFWNQVGNGPHAAEARTLADLADSVAIFRRSQDDAQQQFDQGHYREAIDTASMGLGRLPSAADPAYRDQLQAVISRAESNLQGQESLAQANELMGAYRIIDAQRVAGVAEQQLALAGDDARASEARDLRLRAQQIQQMAATAALVVALLSGGAFWFGRGRATPAATTQSSKRGLSL